MADKRGYLHANYIEEENGVIRMASEGITLGGVIVIMVEHLVLPNQILRPRAWISGEGDSGTEVHNHRDEDYNERSDLRDLGTV